MRRSSSAWFVLRGLLSGYALSFVLAAIAVSGCESAAPLPDVDAASVPDAASGVCVDDVDCSDRLYCNGTERCSASDPSADARGCVAGEPPCEAGTTCDEVAGRCRVDCPVEPDADGDGHIRDDCGGDDCDDTDANRFPGNAEACDASHDEDCNPDTYGFVDADGDGAGSIACCNGINCGPDCDDANASIGPGETDGPPLTCDGLDNDCNGTADAGCPCIESATRACGTPAQLMSIGLCRPGTQFCVAGSWTEMCAGGTPIAEERCDGFDNDCDGTTDEGVERTFYRDADGDGYGVPGETTEACSAPDGYAPNPDDCDDTRAGVSPDAAEVCNGRDDDCDASTDEGVQRTFFRDADGDGFGVLSMTMLGCVPPAGYTDRPGDCDDVRGAVSPSALETCDGRDNDCDMTTDPGCSCTDGMTRGCGTSSVGACTMGTQRCIGGVWAECVGAIAPVPETCNTVDDDCDTRVDETTLRTFYRDADGDGFGRTGMMMQACAQPGGYSALSTDCNDSSAAVNPAQPESCDGIDNNCVMGTDEGCLCTDGMLQPCGTSDGMGGLLTDGECVAGSQLCLGGRWGSCIGTVGPTTDVCNTRDDDCDGNVDEGTTRTCYFDGDRDGVGAGPGATVCRAAGGACPTSYAATGTDCNDMVASIRPGASEVCNGIDDDCDMAADQTFACVQNAITYCTTACGTAGQRTCTASCAWREPVCSAPAESCNYCDDNGDGTSFDESALAVATARLSGDCTTGGTVVGTASCQTYSVGSPLSITHRTARIADTGSSGAGGFWFDSPIRVGYLPITFDVNVTSTDFTTSSPSHGWALVVASDTGATLGGSTTTLGVPYTRRGLAVEWRFYTGTVATAADELTVRRLIGIGSGFVLATRSPPSGAHLNNGSVVDVSREQTMRVEYTPADPLLGVSERLRVLVFDPSTSGYNVVADSSAMLGGFTAGLGWTPGTTLYVGVVATSPSPGSRVDAELQLGPFGAINPSTFVTAQHTCAP